MLVYGGSVIRRALTLLIALAAAVAVYRLLATSVGDLLGLDDVVAGPLVNLLFMVGGLAAAVAIAGVLGVASASERGFERVRRMGLPRILQLGSTGRAASNGAIWFGLAVLAVHFTAPAFTPVPGGPNLVAVALGATLGYGTYRLHLGSQLHDTYRTFNLVGMLLAAGSVASMSSTSTGEWWTKNFSTLGTSDDFAAACFNVAIIGAGACIVLLSRSLTSAVPEERFGARRGGVATMRTLIAMLGACLSGVGLVPIDTDTDLHNVFALGSAVCFGLLALGVQFWARRMPRSLVLLSYAFVVVEVAAMTLYDGVGLFNLTVFEVIAFSLVVAWLIALVATTVDHTRRESGFESIALSSRIRRHRVARRGAAPAFAPTRPAGRAPVRSRAGRALSAVGSSRTAIASPGAARDEDDPPDARHHGVPCPHGPTWRGPGSGTGTGPGSSPVET